MDIPPPPPSPPSPEDAPPPYAAAPPPYGGTPSPYETTQAGQPPQAPPPPRAPYETASPYGQPQAAPYGGANPYQQGPVPYGAPGPYGGGYPVQPQGWYAVERTTNGLAIASLVTSFTCVPLLGAALGVAGLRQIKRRGQRGRGLAIAGVTLSTVGTLFVALMITLGVLGVFHEGNTSVENIKVGQCFDTVGSSLSDYSSGSGRRSTTVNVVSCDKSHDAEAFAVFTLDPSLGSYYPGVDQVARQSSEQCASYADQYLNGGQVPDSMGIFYYMPPKEAWDRNERGVTCFFGSRDGKVSGSVKSGASGTDGGSTGGSSGGSGGGSDGGSGDSGGIGV